jgi:hypothetical protein
MMRLLIPLSLKEEAGRRSVRTPFSLRMFCGQAVSLPVHVPARLLSLTHTLAQQSDLENAFGTDCCGSLSACSLARSLAEGTARSCSVLLSTGALLPRDD